VTRRKSSPLRIQGKFLPPQTATRNEAQLSKHVGSAVNNQDTEDTESEVRAMLDRVRARELPLPLSPRPEQSPQQVRNQIQLQQPLKEHSEHHEEKVRPQARKVSGHCQQPKNVLDAWNAFGDEECGGGDFSAAAPVEAVTPRVLVRPQQDDEQEQSMQFEGRRRGAIGGGSLGEALKDAGGDDADIDEEAALRFHEGRLADEMARIRRRKGELQRQRHESSLREATARELKLQQGHLHRDLQTRLECITTNKGAEEKRLHALKGALASNIQELMTLYEATSAREKSLEQESKTACETVKAEVTEKLRVMESAAQTALVQRLREVEEEEGETRE